jgi:hypothetical protein
VTTKTLTHQEHKELFQKVTSGLKSSLKLERYLIDLWTSPDDKTSRAYDSVHDTARDLLELQQELIFSTETLYR